MIAVTGLEAKRVLDAGQLEGDAVAMALPLGGGVSCAIVDFKELISGQEIGNPPRSQAVYQFSLLLLVHGYAAPTTKEVADGGIWDMHETMLSAAPVGMRRRDVGDNVTGEVFAYWMPPGTLQRSWRVGTVKRFGMSGLLMNFRTSEVEF